MRDGHQTFAERKRGGAGSGGGIQQVTSSDGSITVTNPTGPIVDITLPPSDLPRFQLALSYGQGSIGNDDLNAAESFWFQPQSIVNSPLPDQPHEWPTSRELTFIGVTIFVNAANIILTADGDEPRFIITVDEIDTIFQVALTAGAHVDQLLQANGIIAIPAGSRVGVRFDGSGVDAGSTLRCEMILDGAETGTPIPPPPIPTSQLLFDWQSENFALTPTTPGNATAEWTDATANNNDLGHGNAALANLPTIVPGAFNTHPGIAFARLSTFELTSLLPATCWAPNGARTLAFVLQPDNIWPGVILNTKGGFGGTNVDYWLTQIAAPQGVMRVEANEIETITDFFDTNGQKIVVMFWTTGAIGDPVHVSINGVEPTLTGVMADEVAAFVTFWLGWDNDVFFPDSKRFSGMYARGLGWSRVLTVSERIGVVGNLTAEYL